MGIYFSRVDHAFFPEINHQICQLDEMLLAISNSVDTLQLSIKKLLCELDGIFTVNDEGTSPPSNRQKTIIELSKCLLENNQKGLCHQTTSLLQEISQLAGMVRKRSDKGKPITQPIPRLEKLKIDEHLSGLKPQLSEQFQSKPAENTKNLHNNCVSADKSNKDTDVAIAKLKEENNKFSKDLQKLTDTNKANLKKIEELKELNAKLLKETDECKGTVKRLQEENDQLMKEKEDLKNKIIKLEQESVQIAPVQLFSQKRNEQVGFVIQEIVAQLNVKGRFGTKKLAFITCENSSDILPGLPLLVLCINASRLGTDAAKSFEGITKPENSALIVLHYKDEHALPEQRSDRVLGEPEFKALAGIFDIGFQSAKGIYQCERNTDAITGVVNFINKVLEENPLKVHIK